MDFRDDVRRRSANFARRVEVPLDTEEATKNALILPFITMLGYDFHDPTEVIPEYNAGLGARQHDRVDYALMQNGKPTILIECKKYGSSLHIREISQLFSYFAATDARFGILTDGITYRFFSDLDQPNKMDEQPFFEFNMLDFDDSAIEELRRFTKAEFDQIGNLDAARELRYATNITRVLEEEFASPSQELVNLIARRAYDGRITPTIRQKFEFLVPRAISDSIEKRVDTRLKSALERREAPAPLQVQDETTDQDDDQRPSVNELEQEALYVIKAILREVVDVRRVYLRATQTYCNVLLDDNIRRRICVLRLRTDTMRLGLFHEPRVETSEDLADLDDLYGHANSLRATVGRILAPATTNPPYPYEGSKQVFE